MTYNECIKIFKEKGYCVVSVIDNCDITYYCDEDREPKLEDVEPTLSSYEFGKIEFENDEGMFSTRNIVYYDDERVDIEIVPSLESYVEKVLAVNESLNLNNEKSYVNSYIYYRGHSNWTYLLQPSIYREENKRILINEDKLFRDILSSKPHFFSDCNTTLEKLVKMQHHGIPTRLLDLTDNPLIALYFACNGSKNNQPAEVLIFKVPENKLKYYDSDTVSVIANLVKCNYRFNISEAFDLCNDVDNLTADIKFSIDVKESQMYEYNLAEKIKEFNNIKIVSELIHYIREDKPYFLDKINPLDLKDHTLVVKPKMAIDRIVNQSGAFVLFGINGKKANCSKFNINENGYKQKILIIPSDCKEKILKQLNLFNINESTVFGDIDNTAKFFKNKYLSLKNKYLK